MTADPAGPITSTPRAPTTASPRGLGGAHRTGTQPRGSYAPQGYARAGSRRPGRLYAAADCGLPCIASTSPSRNGRRRCVVRGNHQGNHCPAHVPRALRPRPAVHPREAARLPVQRLRPARAHLDAPGRRAGRAAGRGAQPPTQPPGTPHTRDARHATYARPCDDHERTAAADAARPRQERARGCNACGTDDAWYGQARLLPPTQTRPDHPTPRRRRSVADHIRRLRAGHDRDRDRRTVRRRSPHHRTDPHQRRPWATACSASSPPRSSGSAWHVSATPWSTRPAPAAAAGPRRPATRSPFLADRLGVTDDTGLEWATAHGADPRHARQSRRPLPPVRVPAGTVP
jgi:hypothetical protein